MLICSEKKLLITIFILVSTLASGQDFRNGMVVTASPLASKVGNEILKKGGNAVDAAVAVGFALAVTYPAAGNLGGGGFMVIHTNDSRDITIDYREKAPLKAHRDMFLDGDGNYISESSTNGINSSGVPGSVAGLLYALNKYGTMTIREVIQPAINLAEDGFPLDSSAASSINNSLWLFNKYSSSVKIFTKNGIPYKPGDIFKQPDLAETLKRIAASGKDGFYKGRTAELLIDQVRKMNGIMTQQDLDSYLPIERPPVTGYYRGLKVVSMGPPSSGGIALIQLLNVLENKIFIPELHNSSEYLHTITEAIKYVYADRSEYLGDPDFYNVPVKKLLAKQYAREIYSGINQTAVPSELIRPGKYFSESLETTHYSVYDKFGNAVSTTTTLNSGYGNGLIVDGAGFLLNNEMDDFSVKSGVPNQFGLLGSNANSVEPGKRMLSSMTPTIVLKGGKPYIIVGSPGGSTIMTVVLQVILNIVDFQKNISDAVNAPRIHHQWYPDKTDYENISDQTLGELEKRGHKLGNRRRLGLVEAILISDDNSFSGASDRRGSGAAEGY